MFVRMKIGARAGEVVEVAYAIGVDLVRDKKAEKVSFDPDSPAPPPALELQATPNVAEIAQKSAAAQPETKKASHKKPAASKGK